MERPASRGLLAAGVAKAPTGVQIERPERPSTASRHTAAGPPGTASGSRAPATAMRGSAPAPPGTAYKRVTAAGTPIQQSLQAHARPLTQQGIGGTKPMTQATGRQVLDRTYFINELRQKRQQIINVNAQMRDELDILVQKKAAVVRADKLSVQLKKDVRLLQEALADNNIIIDKAGSHAPIQHIRAEYADIRARNEQQNARAEDILSQRLALEQRTKQVDSQMAAIQSTMDHRLSSMAPSARQAYSELLAEQAALLTEAERFEMDIAELNEALAAAEGELGRNQVKQRALQLQEQIKLLTERKYELASTEDASKASPEEQQASLLARIKRDNAAVEQTTREAKRLQEEIRELEVAVASANAKQSDRSAAGEIPPAADEESRREKYQELTAKERELNVFLDAFPQRRAAKQAELSSRAEAITAVLERLNKLHASAAGALPSQGHFQDMKDELDYKQQQLQSAAATEEALKAELQARKAELEKIDTLGSKISQELEILKSRMDNMQQEVGIYSNVDQAKSSKEATRQELEQQRAMLVAQHDAVKAELVDQSWQQQAKETQLRENSSWPAINRLEQQLQQLQIQIDNAQQFILEHEEKANYKPMVGQIMELIAAINSANINLLAAV